MTEYEFQYANLGVIYRGYQSDCPLDQEPD